MSSGIAASITEDDLLGGAVRIRQPARGYRVTSDAVLLAALTPVQSGQRVLEMGTGYGQVALCLLARAPDLQVTGLELMAAAAALARENAALNGWGDHLFIVEGSVETYDGQHDFDVVVCNPPYRPATTHTPSPDPIKAAATVLQQPLPHWAACAARALAPTGHLVMILDARQEAAAVDACIQADLGQIQILPLASFSGDKAKRILLLARYGGGALSRLPDLVMHEADSSWRAEIKDILMAPKALHPWCA